MKFQKYKWKEVFVSYRDGKFYVSIVFEVKYEPYFPQGIIGLDVNLRQLVYYDGKKVRRADTPFIKAQTIRKKAEKIQQRYPRMWRYNKRLTEKVKKYHRRAKNIVVDGTRKFAKEFVLFAERKKYAISIEELTGLIEELRSLDKENRWKTMHLDYRTLQNAIITKAIEYNVPIMKIDPRGTSKLCYRCGTELKFQGRLGICPKCGFVADRDKNASLNIYKRMWGSLGSLLKAPAVKDEVRRSRGRRMRGCGGLY